MTAPPASIRTLLCTVAGAPGVLWLGPDARGDHCAALDAAVGGAVACLTLHDGVGLWCNRGSLALGLRMRRLGLAVPPPELTLGWSPDLRPLPPASRGDLLLARFDSDGRLAGLREEDLRHWMFWLEPDAATYH